MNQGKVVLGVAAGLIAIYVVAAPYITVYQMKSAAERHDGEALSEHVEFPSVRQSLKDQMNAMIVKKIAEDATIERNPFAALGAALAGMMVDKMVDAYVTPAGITQLMAGEKPQVQVKAQPRPQAAQGEEASGSTARTPFSEARMSYESLDKFVVRVKGNDGAEGKFVLRRRGFGWKLTDIIFSSWGHTGSTEYRQGAFEHLFINHRTGERYTTIAKSWGRLRSKAGLPHLRIPYYLFLTNLSRTPST